MKDPMLDEEFLRELDQYPHKFLWAKIISLNKDEYPLDEITGKITSGSVNVDGTSVMRRTCSMTMVAEDVKINDYYWGLKTKFKFFIGVENLINPEYPGIIWFNEGTFVLTSFSCTVGVNNYTINLQGKDKMTLLNGDFGGVIPASWDFATEDANVTDEDGNTLYDSTGFAIIKNTRIPIKDIILQAVHEFAQERWQNIIVNDLDDYGIELLEYRGETPLYYIIGQEDDSGDNSREVWNMTMNGGMNCWIRPDHWENGELVQESWDNAISTTLGQIETTTSYKYEKLMEMLDPSGNVTETPDYTRAFVKLDLSSDKVYTIAKITRDNGMQVCGYRITDIVYPYDLIVSPGETVTSVLDKLVQMLGNFEYFYDVDGRFIFQKKRTYLDVSYNNIINEHSINPEVWADSSMYNSKYTYVFDDHLLISSVQNAPNLSNLKNDYSLWGQRVNGNVTIPIHMRYAIDKKPMYYKVIGYKLQIVEINDKEIKISYKGKVTEDNPLSKTPKDGDTYKIDENQYLVAKTTINENGELENVEWLEYNWPSIYSNADKTFITEEGIEYFSNLSFEGNEELKIDLNAEVVDWREIIFQMANDYRRWYRDPDTDFLTLVRNNNIYNGYDSLYENGHTGYEQYYIDFEMNLSQGVVAYWRELYNPEAKGQSGRYDANGVFKDDRANIPDWTEGEYNKGDLVYYTNDGIRNVYKSLRDKNTKEPGGTNWWALSLSQFTYNSSGWNVNILDNPEMLNFWFDFIDTTGELSKYSVHNIGLRSKATNDDKIKAIYFREVPNVIFDVNGEQTQKDKWRKPGYCYVNIPAGLNALFNISSRGKNAMDVVEEYLYSYTYPATSITLTTVPIYYLTPNTLIYVNDKQTGAVGEYIMQKYSIQLGLGASMSISAVETAKRIY